jgi:hypothetical protein
MLLASMKVDFNIFLPSPRNSEEAQDSLLKELG